MHNARIIRTQALYRQNTHEHIHPQINTKKMKIHSESIRILQLMRNANSITLYISCSIDLTLPQKIVKFYNHVFFSTPDVSLLIIISYKHKEDRFSYMKLLGESLILAFRLELSFFKYSILQILNG